MMIKQIDTKIRHPMAFSHHLDAPIIDISTHIRIIQRYTLFVLYSSLTKDQMSWLLLLMKDYVVLCLCSIAFNLSYNLHHSPFCPPNYSYLPLNRMDAGVVRIENSRHHIMLIFCSLLSTLLMNESS